MSDKIKTFELDSIAYNPVIIENIAGISAPALDYTSSIGGADKPEEGADKTSENTAAGITNQGDLAVLNAINTAQIVDRAIETNKIALLAITEDVLASNAVTASKILAGTITANEIAADTITANEIYSGYVYAGNISAGQIITGTLSGITISGNTIYVNGDALRIRDTSSNQVGYLYGLSGVMKLIAATSSEGLGSVTLELDASSGYVKNRATYFHPYTDNTSYLGGSTTIAGGSLTGDKTWKYIGGQVIDAKDLYKLNDITVIDQAGTTIYIKSGGGGLVLQDGSTTIATFSSSGGIDLAAGKEIDGQFAHLDCIVLANNDPLNENGSMYSDGTNLYVRLSGTWKTVTTS